MLREELPEIITGHVPGPKAKALLKREMRRCQRHCVDIHTQSVSAEEKEPS